MTIKGFLQLKSPRNVYVPYPVARTGKKSIQVILRMLTKVGLKANLPPELMFLGAFYRTQTISSEKLDNSSFVDPMPNETVYTRLADMIPYYLTCWSRQNLITTFEEKVDFDGQIHEEFKNNPTALLKSIQRDATTPFE